ncbi:MAG: GTPase HflX, partial [Nitrospinota bacterium]
LAALTRETGRQVGLLVNRRGRVETVIVGTPTEIVIPPLKRFRTGRQRLRGLRCLHTHLGGEGCTHDDLVDLAVLRLDLMTALEVTEEGLPGRVSSAHLMPDGNEAGPWRLLEPSTVQDLDLDVAETITSLEEELARAPTARALEDVRDRAICIHVSTGSRAAADDSLTELVELARSAGSAVVDTVVQPRDRVDPKFVVGRGKLQELVIRCMQREADLLIFDGELTTAQIRALTAETEIKILDRTQLILDIFAQRAASREGKIQVELAQLRYRLSRLVGKGEALSRLTGGIGGRGPGETKLEVDRRRIRERIHRLERQLKGIGRARTQRRARRQRTGMPILSIIGYTNAGKSTLLNALTHSEVAVDDRLFATLDPASRRLRFPRDLEVIITDTVGFIRDLPRDLLQAFHATLEELAEADLLLHVVDLASPYYEDHMRSVQTILAELGYGEIPRMLVFNKADLIEPARRDHVVRRLGGVAISAIDTTTLPAFIEAVEERLFELLDLSPSVQRAAAELHKAVDHLGS